MKAYSSQVNIQPRSDDCVWEKSTSFHSPTSRWGTSRVGGGPRTVTCNHTQACLAGFAHLVWHSQSNPVSLPQRRLHGAQACPFRIQMASPAASHEIPICPYATPVTKDVAWTTTKRFFFNSYSLNCNIWKVSNKCVGIAPCQTLPHKHGLFSLKEQGANSHWAVMQATWCPRTPGAADSTEISLEESLPSAGPSPFPSLLLVPNTAQDTWLQGNTKWLLSKVHLTPRENCHIFQSTTHQERLHLPLNKDSSNPQARSAPVWFGKDCLPFLEPEMHRLQSWAEHSGRAKSPCGAKEKPGRPSHLQDRLGLYICRLLGRSQRWTCENNLFRTLFN